MIGRDLANKKIVRGYKADKILTSEKRVFDFLPEIKPTLDGEIVESWEEFFRKKGVPYIITEFRKKGQPKRWKMWKFLLVSKGLNYV